MKYSRGYKRNHTIADGFEGLLDVDVLIRDVLYILQFEQETRSFLQNHMDDVDVLLVNRQNTRSQLVSMSVKVQAVYSISETTDRCVQLGISPLFFQRDFIHIINNNNNNSI